MGYRFESGGENDWDGSGNGGKSDDIRLREVVVENWKKKCILRVDGRVVRGGGSGDVGTWGPE